MRLWCAVPSRVCSRKHTLCSAVALYCRLPVTSPWPINLHPFYRGSARQFRAFGVCAVLRKSIRSTQKHSLHSCVPGWLMRAHLPTRARDDDIIYVKSGLTSGSEPQERPTRTNSLSRGVAEKRINLGPLAGLRTSFRMCQPSSSH